MPSATPRDVLNEATAHAAAKWWGDRLRQGDRMKFEAVIKDHVLKHLESNGRCYLECDYDPFGALLEAVKAAGLDCRGFMFSAKGILPQKHALDIEPGVLKPKEGYGNWTADIKVAA